MTNTNSLTKIPTLTGKTNYPVLYNSNVSRDFLGIPFLSRGFRGRSPKGHNREL